MDSYVKFAKDVFGNYLEHPLFSCVHPTDKEEVAVKFATFVAADLDYYADTFRITHTKDGAFNNLKEHQKKQGCCGCAESLVKCKSGSKYFIGYNFGH